MFDTIITLINACGCDIDFYTVNNTIYITIDDFSGFDDDWNEIMRDYDNPDAVNALLNWLDNNCISQTGDLYTFYSFNDFKVELGYTSFDI